MENLSKNIKGACALYAMISVLVLAALGLLFGDDINDIFFSKDYDAYSGDEDESFRDIGGGEYYAGAAIGSLVVTVTKTGAEPIEFDQFLVNIEGENLDLRQTSDDGNGKTEHWAKKQNLPSGDTSIRLENVPINCEIQGDNPVTVSIPTGGNIFDHNFEVLCKEFTATIEIETRTLGEVPDADYTISLSAIDVLPVIEELRANDVNRYDDRTPASYVTKIDGLPEDCVLTPESRPSPYNFELPILGYERVLFIVRCGAEELENDEPIGGTEIEVGVGNDLTGRWKFDTHIIEAEGICIGEEGKRDSFVISIEQVGSKVSLSGFEGNSSNTLTGSIEGNRLEYSGSYSEDGGTTNQEKTTLAVDFDRMVMAGLENWSWTGEGETCRNGETEIVATKIN